MTKTPLKKVAYFSLNSFLGGAETATLNYCSSHLKFGQWIPILILLNEGELAIKARSLGVETYVLNSQVKFRNPFSLIRCAKKLKSYLFKNNIQMIHSSMGYAQLISSLATLGTDIKKVWYQHGPVGTIFDRCASLFKSDYTLYNSLYLKEKGDKVPATFSHRSKVVPPIVEEIDLKLKNSDVIRFSHIGRIAPFKNLDMTIRVLAKIKPSQFIFNIFGDAHSSLEKEYLEYLKELVEELKLEDSIVFKGFESNLGHIYQQTDCVLHSSLVYEPFGLTIAEALVSGVPVICSRNSGAVEEFHNNRECLTHQNEKELELCIRELLEMSFEKRLDMVERAKEKSRRLFSSKNVIKNLEECYNEI